MNRFSLLLSAIVALSQFGCGHTVAQDENAPPAVQNPANPTLGGAHEAEYEKGNVAFDRKEWETALAHYNAALKSKADHVPSLVNRGRVSIFQGKLNEALADFSKATELNPDHAYARTLLAAACLDKGDHAAAIRSADKAIALDEKQGYAWYTRGTAKLHQGEFAKGIDDLNEAAKLMPNDPVVFNNRGIAWQKLGDQAKAKADFDRRDRLSPPAPAPQMTKQQAKEQMDAALARFEKSDFHVKSLQNRKPAAMTRPGPAGAPYNLIVPVPPELLQMREDAWNAYLKACEVFNKIP